MTRVLTLTLFLVVLSMNAFAQPPMPPAVQQQEKEPDLPNELRLERENLLLTARINELETQLAALKAQLVNDRIGQIAPSLIERLEKAAPEYDVNPQTLQLTRKQTAGSAVPAVPPAPTPAPVPAQPRP